MLASAAHFKGSSALDMLAKAATTGGGSDSDLRGVRQAAVTGRGDGSAFISVDGLVPYDSSQLLVAPGMNPTW